MISGKFKSRKLSSMQGESLWDLRVYCIELLAMTEADFLGTFASDDLGMERRSRPQNSTLWDAVAKIQSIKGTFWTGNCYSWWQSLKSLNSTNTQALNWVKPTRSLSFLPTELRSTVIHNVFLQTCMSECRSLPIFIASIMMFADTPRDRAMAPHAWLALMWKRSHVSDTRPINDARFLFKAS